MTSRFRLLVPESKGLAEVNERAIRGIDHIVGNFVRITAGFPIQFMHDVFGEPFERAVRCCREPRVPFGGKRIKPQKNPVHELALMFLLGKIRIGKCLEVVR